MLLVRVLICWWNRLKHRGPAVHILINDFIGGALDRGIPLYVRNLIEGLGEEGIRVSIVRAPRICRKLPRALFYAIAVMVEQFALSGDRFAAPGGSDDLPVQFPSRSLMS